MRNIFRSKKNAAGCIQCLCPLLLLVLFVPQMTAADTLNSRYPGISTGLLKSAERASLDENTPLTFIGVAITRTELIESLKDQTPGLREQLGKNLIFMLEQEAVRRVLLSEAEKAGIAVAGGDENRAIQALFDDRVRDLTVSENEAQALLYAANKEMMGNAPFEQVAARIGQYLLQDKQQQAVSHYIDGLGDSVAMRINGPWVEAQARVAMDNPADKKSRPWWNSAPRAACPAT